MSGFTVWFTGLSGSGKSTLARRVAETISEGGQPVELLDGDRLRAHFSKGVGFGKADRDAHVMRVGYLCRLLNKHGVAAVAALISPYEEARLSNRELIGDYAEIHCDCDLETLIARDPKGLYRRALAGEIKNFTGIDDPYEKPAQPELVVDTARQSEEASWREVMTKLAEIGYYRRP